MADMKGSQQEARKLTMAELRQHADARAAEASHQMEHGHGAEGNAQQQQRQHEGHER